MSRPRQARQEPPERTNDGERGPQTRRETDGNSGAWRPRAPQEPGRRTTRITGREHLERRRRRSVTRQAEGRDLRRSSQIGVPMRADRPDESRRVEDSRPEAEGRREHGRKRTEGRRGSVWWTGRDEPPAIRNTTKGPAHRAGNRTRKSQDQPVGGDDDEQSSISGAGHSSGHASGQSGPRTSRQDGSEVDDSADREVGGRGNLLPGTRGRTVERGDAGSAPARPRARAEVARLEAPAGSNERSKERADEGPRTGAQRDADPLGPQLLRGREPRIRDPGRGGTRSGATRGSWRSTVGWTPRRPATRRGQPSRRPATEYKTDVVHVP